LHLAGRRKESEQVQLRALRILEKALGPEHPELVSGLLNLALLYSDQRRFAEAESLLERCRRICETRLGPGHPMLGNVLLSYARVLRQTRRKPEAKDFKQRADMILQHHAKDNLLHHTIDVFAFQ
jgi:tetratricopeptide (TPR) repeat protein